MSGDASVLAQVILYGVPGLVALVAGLCVNRFTKWRWNLGRVPVYTVLSLYGLFTLRICTGLPSLMDDPEAQSRVAGFLGAHAGAATIAACVLWLVGRQWNKPSPPDAKDGSA